MTIRRYAYLLGLGIAVAAGLHLASTNVARAADAYKFDKGHTSILFSYDHLGLARQTFRFLDFDGEVMFDKAKPEETAASMTIKSASISTDNEVFDKKLKSKDYFNVKEHPEITFKSTSARRTGPNSGLISGDLTINGITKPITFDVLYRFSGDHPLGAILKKYKGMLAAGFSARTTVLRSDFGMGGFVPLVSDDVEIVVEMELLKDKN